MATIDFEDCRGSFSMANVRAQNKSTLLGSPTVLQTPPPSKAAEILHANCFAPMPPRSQLTSHRGAHSMHGSALHELALRLGSVGQTLGQ
eukprot:6208419-Pleurochrysis_carterae.AAC.5